MSQHPPRHEMEAYLQGTLAPEAAEPLSQHLGECPECSETVANLEQQSADTFASDLRKRPAVEPFADESQFQRAMAELREGAAALAAPKLPNDERTELLHTRLGEYELLAVLGEGGMGAVYKARHCRLEKLVALKVLAAARMRDPAVVARFQREMKAVGQLRHANIVAAHDAGEHAGRHYLVMELVEGEDLAKLVKRDGPLPIDVACRHIAQAARGLAYAHAKGIVHRDIKPSNLLVDGEGTLKILDLGLARLVDAPAEAGEGLTSESQIMGTPEYMGPRAGREHRRGRRAGRSLQPGLHPLVPAHRPPALHRCLGAGTPLRPPRTPDPLAANRTARCACGTRRPLAEADGQAARRSLVQCRGSGNRPRPHLQFLSCR